MVNNNSKNIDGIKGGKKTRLPRGSVENPRNRLKILWKFIVIKVAFQITGERFVTR